MKNKKNGLILLGIIVVLAIIGGKIHMDKQEAIRQERNQAVKEIQEQASKYIIENYAGIEKIEWNGWSIGAGPFTVNTSMTINDYQDEINGKVQFSYSAGYPQYIEKYTDNNLKIHSFEEMDDSKATMQKTLQLQGVIKSKIGSSNAEIIYNWEESRGKNK